MKQAIKIFDTDETGSLLPQLHDLVRLATAEGAEFQWKLVELEGAVGDVTAWWPGGMVDLERHLAAGEVIELTRAQLSDLARLTAPAAWLSLVGDSGAEQIALRLHDSTFWEVETGSRELLARFSAAYSDVR